MHIKSEELMSSVYKELLQTNTEMTNRKMDIGYDQVEEIPMFQPQYS